MTITLAPEIVWLISGLILMLQAGVWIAGRGDAFDINRVYGMTWRNWADRWVALFFAVGAIGVLTCVLIIFILGLSTLV